MNKSHSAPRFLPARRYKNTKVSKGSPEIEMLCPAAVQASFCFSISIAGMDVGSMPAKSAR